MQVCCSESRTHSPVLFATPFFEIIMVYYRLFLCSWIAPSTDIRIVSSRNDFVFVLTVIGYCCNACDVHLFFVPPPDIFFFYAAGARPSSARQLRWCVIDSVCHPLSHPALLLLLLLLCCTTHQLLPLVTYSCCCRVFKFSRFSSSFAKCFRVWHLFLGASRERGRDSPPTPLPPVLHPAPPSNSYIHTHRVTHLTLLLSRELCKRRSERRGKNPSMTSWLVGVSFAWSFLNPPR